MIGHAEVKKVLSCLSSVLLLSLFFIGISGVGAKGKTNLLVMQGTWWKDQVPILKEKYEQTHPDVNLDFRLMGYQGMREQQVLNLMLGKAADVFCIQNEMWVPGFVDKDLIAPWDEYVGPDKPIRPEWFMPKILEKHYMEGHQWSIPFRVNPDTLFYNNNMFREAGLNPDVGPSNFKEMKKYARFLTNPEKDIYGFVWEAASGGFEYLVLEFLGTFGAGFYNEEGTKATINSPSAIEAVDFMASFVREGLVPQSSMGFTDNQSERFFGLRKAAMLVTGYGSQWVIDDVWPDLDFSKDIGTSVIDYGYVNSMSLAMPKNPKLPEESARFVGWFIENLPELTIRIPCTKRMGEWANKPRAIPFLRQGMEGAKKILNLIPETTEIQTIVTKQIQRVCVGEATAKEAMDIAAKEINKILSE